MLIAIVFLLVIFWLTHFPTSSWCTSIFSVWSIHGTSKFSDFCTKHGGGLLLEFGTNTRISTVIGYYNCLKLHSYFTATQLPEIPIHQFFSTTVQIHLIAVPQCNTWCRDVNLITATQLILMQYSMNKAFK